MSEKEMKFMQLGKRERKLLLEALGLNIKNLVCERCGEKISYEKCSIMPPLNISGKQATILCESPLCLVEYLDLMGDSYPVEPDKKKLFEDAYGRTKKYPHLKVEMEIMNEGILRINVGNDTRNYFLKISDVQEWIKEEVKK